MIESSATAYGKSSIRLSGFTLWIGRMVKSAMSLESIADAGLCGWGQGGPWTERVKYGTGSLSSPTWRSIQARSNLADAK